MEEHLTLKQALDTWNASGLSPEAGHLSPEELCDLLLQLATRDLHHKMVAHLCRCPACLREFQALVQSMAEAAAWDLALPKAAATQAQGSLRITTEGGKYTIEIRPHLSDKSRGLITVQTALQHREALEGVSIVLKDNRGRILLSGRIVSGEVSQEVADLDQIEYGLMVQPG